MKITLIREEGFTLLEVVFASALLAFAIMAYTILKTSSRHSRVYSKNLSQAIELTSTQLEWLRIQGFTSGAMDGADAGTDFFYTVDGPGDPLKIGDFEATETVWNVRNRCPSELTKLVDYQTQWNTKTLDFAQVQTSFD